MKMIIENVSGEGLELLLGQKITVLCANYFYTGKLLGVNSDCILLSEPQIIYETGEWSTKDWADAQKLPTEKLYVMKSAIESFGILK